MKKLILIIIMLFACQFGFSQITDDSLRSYTNTYIITNAARAITGSMMNTIMIDVIDSKVNVDSATTMRYNGDTLFLTYWGYQEDTIILSEISEYATVELDNLSNVAINVALLPGVTNSIALGSGLKNWSDLYIGALGIINWDNGDVLLSHVANRLNLSGGDFSPGEGNIVWSNGANLQNDDADTLDISETVIKLDGVIATDSIFKTIATNQDFIVNPNGTGVISVLGTTNYEDNVTADDDIPNKKYTDKYTDDVKYWSRTGNYVYPKTIGDSMGIGTATPGAKFEVNNDAIIDGMVIKSDVTSMFYGLNAGELCTGSNKYGFGQYALQYCLGTERVISIGERSPRENVGKRVIGIGFATLNSNAGDNCIGIGINTLWGNVGDNNTSIGHMSGYPQDNTGAQKTFSPSDVITATDRIVITGHSFASVGEYTNIRFTTTGTLPSGLDDVGYIYTFKVIDVDTIENVDIITDITTQGSGTHTATPITIHSNLSLYGYNVKPSTTASDNQSVFGANAIGQGSNTATIGDDNITDIYMNENGTAKLHASTLGTSGQIIDNSDSLIDANAVHDYVDGLVPSGIESGTANGEILFWDTDTWKHTETSELVWDDGNKRVGIGMTTPGAKLDVAGHIWQTSVGKSVFLGEGAGLVDDLSDNYNVFIGYRSGFYNTTGNSNNFIGSRSGFYNTTGNSNNFIGFQSGYYNTTGYSNNFIGYRSGYYNEGNNNTAIGTNAFNTFNEDAGDTENFDFGDIQPDGDTITITGHGWTGSVNLKYTEGTAPITGITNGDIDLWKVVDVNTLKGLTTAITNAGAGTGHIFTHQFVYTNSTTLGYNAKPDASNQVMLEAANITEVKTAGSLNIGGTATISTIAAGVADYDKFIVSDGGLFKFRTGAELLSDIGGQASITPAALTKTDDTNVTLTLGGTPSTSLLQATSLTLGWTGTLADGRIASSTDWNTAYTDRLKWDGGATGLTPATGRTSLGANTIGSNLFTLANPSAITFIRLNAANTVSALNAADFRTAIGAGTSSTVGTVTSVGFADGTGFTISGSPITSSGSFTFTQDFSEFTDITESTGIKFVVTDPIEKEIAIGNIDLSDFNNDAFANQALSNLSSVAINAALLLGTSDAFALGSITKMWSDLFIASGGVINWNNGDITFTHSANLLTLGGGNLGLGSNNLILTGYAGRDSDNYLSWSPDDHLKIKIAGTETDIVSISTGVGDNDKLVTQGYVDAGDADFVPMTYAQPSLNSTAVSNLGSFQQLIAAPGANKYIRIIAWDVKITVTGRIEVGTQHLSLVYSGGIAGVEYIGLISNSDVETASTQRFLQAGNSISIEIAANTAVGVQLSAGTNPSSGDATMSFNITYEILDY